MIRGGEQVGSAGSAGSSGGTGGSAGSAGSSGGTGGSAGSAGSAGGTGASTGGTGAGGGNCDGVPQWQAGSHSGGDRVQNVNNLYECKPFPYEAWCSQSSYEPGVALAWQEAWILIGPCQGSGSGGTGGTGGSGGSAGSAGEEAGGAGGATGGSGGAGSAGEEAGGPGSATGGTGGSDTGCPAEGPSCAGGLDCNGESCCTTIAVPGGTYNRGADPSYPATVADFCLDKYEVTVGRLRKFVDAYDAWIGGGHPAAGEGAHPLISGSGWQNEWNAGDELPASAAVFKDSGHLKCEAGYQTWRDTAGTGTQESYPINCVSWYEAFAFCIWDGGRLPTEAEWEHAAGAGDQNRLYPWGNNSTEPLPANYVWNHNTPFLAVGSEPDGNGLWGHSDLAGSMGEWNLDWYASPHSPAVCDNCANLTTASNRVARGGYWNHSANDVRAASHGGGNPSLHVSPLGFRCGRQ